MKSERDTILERCALETKVARALVSSELLRFGQRTLRDLAKNRESAIQCREHAVPYIERCG